MGAFADLAASAQTLINDLGRTVILRRDTGATEVDVAKPWLGVTPTFTNVSISVVFDVFSTGEIARTEVLDGDVKGYASSLSLGAVIPKPGDLIVDGTQTLRIMRALHFKPNVDSIAFELHLRPS
tara:strand:- start:1146 stop:1520 length:375 start_codon:yes stop_codon:yes gene_type:complete